jgi:hypothetical protein
MIPLFPMIIIFQMLTFASIDREMSYHAIHRALLQISLSDIGDAKDKALYK